MLLGDRAVEAVLGDWRSAPLEPRLRSALGLIEKLTVAPDAVDAADVVELREVGLSDPAIVDTIFVCAGFNCIDRVADALSFFVPRDFRRGAPIVRKLGYWWMSGTWPDEAGVPRSGVGRKKALFARLEESVLRSPGSLDAAIRLRIADESGAPDALRPYVEKVFRHAYRVTDEDVAALLAAGCDEDQILEATLAAAVGAGRKRLRAGLVALEGTDASARAVAGEHASAPAVSI